MIDSKKIFYPFLLFLLFSSCLVANMPTYFSYSTQELENLRSLSVSCDMNKKDLERWDEFISKATQNDSPFSLKILRFYTYLYVAQAEAIALSYETQGNFSGSLAPLNLAVLSLFYPESTEPKEYCKDPFSIELANVVLNKIKERINKEDAQTAQYTIPKEKASLYVIGLGFAKLLPWYTNPPNDYFPPPPSTSEEFWQQQIKHLKDMQDPLTSEKKKAIQFWAGQINPQSGDWRIIANEFLFSHNIPFPEIIKVRSSVMMGTYDASIVGFNAKYKFMRMRPKEFDSSVHYEIPVPRHPSYPANHALLSWTAATILTHFFPLEKNHWESLAKEAGMSRIWAGIHYPIDIDTGKELGIKIGNKVIKKSN